MLDVNFFVWWFLFFDIYCVMVVEKWVYAFLFSLGIWHLLCNGCGESFLYMCLSITVILLDFYGSYCLDDSRSSLSWFDFHIDTNVRYM